MTELPSPNLVGTFSPFAVHCSKFVVGLSGYIPDLGEETWPGKTPSEWSVTRQTISGGAGALFYIYNLSVVLAVTNPHFYQAIIVAQIHRLM